MQASEWGRPQLCSAATQSVRCAKARELVVWGLAPVEAVAVVAVLFPVPPRCWLLCIGPGGLIMGRFWALFSCEKENIHERNILY